MRCPSCRAARDPRPQTNDAAFRCALRLTACVHAAPRTPATHVPPAPRAPVVVASDDDAELAAVRAALEAWFGGAVAATLTLALALALALALPR